MKSLMMFIDEKGFQTGQSINFRPHISTNIDINNSTKDSYMLPTISSSKWWHNTDCIPCDLRFSNRRYQNPGSNILPNTKHEDSTT